MEIKFAERLWCIDGGDFREFVDRDADSASIIMECASISQTSELERESARNSSRREHRAAAHRDAWSYQPHYASDRDRQLASGEICATAHVSQDASDRTGGSAKDPGGECDRAVD